MDYSKNGIYLKQKMMKSNTRRLKSKLLIMVFRLFLIILVCAAILGVTVAWGAFKGILDTTPSVAIVDMVPEGYSSSSYFSDGTLAQTFAGNEANRVYVEINEIPKSVKDAFVALEDERFYEHGGIDIRGIFRAGYSVVKTVSLDYGASTITQQLIKNQVFSGGREASSVAKLKRKVQEQYLAVELENFLTKDQILEYYLNYINLGNGAYGIQTAANTYFGKDVQDLTISEAAVLAAIAYSPTYNNPVNYKDNNAERREKCLALMRSNNMCTQEQYEAALKDDVYSRITNVSQKRAETNSYFSYFTDELIDQVTNDLVEKLGYTTLQAQNLIYRGGIQIYTTQDPTIQGILDRYFCDEENFPALGFEGGSFYEITFALSVYKEDESVVHYHMKDFLDYFADYDDTDHYYYHEHGGRKGIDELCVNADDANAKIDEFIAAHVGPNDTPVVSRQLTLQPQCSMSIIDQHTGEVKAIYGGRGEKLGSRTLNRASKTLRQVGSTFKVLASFLPAIDAGGKTLASVYDDIQYFYPGGGKEVVNWYGLRSFRGLHSIREAIYNSMNVIAVKNLEAIGATLGYNYLKKLGFSSLVESRVAADGTVYSDKNLSIALGGLTDGVTNVEMSAAFAAIANGGVYNKPIYYTKILDKDGNVILENKTESTQVMKTSTAWLLTDAMHDTTTKGTGSNLRFRNYNMPVAGKTGTATNDNDLWFCGFTPYYTASIWTGFDNNFDQINKSYQQHLWRNVMEEIHATYELPYKEWEMPSSIESATICSKCGKLAVPGLCDEAEGGSCVVTEYFAKGTKPTEKCDCHIRVNVCKKSGKLANDSCKNTVSKVLLIKDEYTYADSEEIIETWDTPYIFHADDVCTVHTEKSGGKKKKNRDSDNDADDAVLPGSSTPDVLTDFTPDE